ncbi:MAG TPA: adenylate/guanylate cyclase domain-containing protein, partial [Rhodothermia bacterium]
MSQTLHILVVDDEPDLEPLIRQRFRRQIKANVYEFKIAHDGQEALQRLEEHPEIDIVLTDINMPRMDGLTLLSKLPETGGLRKAVVVTAYGDMENIRTAMNRGAFDFLTKPIDLEDLEITIRKAQAIVDRERKAELARETFGRYLSDRVVATLLDHPDGMRLGGEKRTATVVMSDIRGFSMISERLKPEEVVEILNIYLGEMTEIIHSFDGTIDEFIGDGILIVFGAPIAHEDDALRAVGCAVAMQLGMDDVNAQLTERGFPKLEMGIGINTGEVVVGNIGSQMRAKYGVVGSHVNLTSRIESFTVGGQILVSGRTLEEAGGVLTVGRRMEVPMKGFAHPVPIFEIV